MKITKVSMLSGKLRSKELDITPQAWRDHCVNKTHVQVAFPNLSASEREFLITGATDEEWDSMFLEDEIEE